MWSGDLTFVNAGLAAAQSAIGAEVEGDSISIEQGEIIRDGLGGLRIVRKGGGGAVVSGIELFGPDKTYLQNYILSGLGWQKTGFPDHTVGADDGTNAYIFALQSCQPASVEIACPYDGVLTAKLEFWAALVELSAATSVNSGQLATTGKGHTHNDIDAKVQYLVGETWTDTGVDVLDWGIKTTYDPRWYAPQKQKTAGTRTLPEAVLLRREDTEVTLVLADTLPLAALDPVADDFVHLRLAVTAANGVTAEDMTLTTCACIPTGDVGLALTAGADVNGNEYTLKSAVAHSTLTLA